MKGKLPLEAFDYYLTLGVGRSYQAVAEKYGVSKVAVTTRAKRDDWQGKIQQIEAEAAKKSQRRAIETREEESERRLKYWQAVERRALEPVRAPTSETVIEAVPAVHLAPNTTSRIVSKSVSKDGGRATYRGQLRVAPGATGVTASVRCDALMLDDQSRSDTYPYIDIQEDDTTMTHEATVGKVSAEQVFYLMSRGLTENEATNLIVQGFLEVFTKELPMEYAIEFNRLVKLEMEGSLG